MCNLLLSICVMLLGQTRLPLPLVPIAKPTMADVAASNYVPIIATQDGNLLFTNTPRSVVADAELHGFKGTTRNGRCLVVNAPFCRLWNLRLVSGDDDALNIIGDSHGTVCVGVVFQVEDWTDSHGLIAYTTPVDSNKPWKIYGAADGYAAQFIGCRFEGSHGAGRLSAGVWNFVDCTICVSALYGFECEDAKVNFIGCRFVTRAKPDAAPWWYAPGNACPIRVTAIKDGKQSATNLRSSIYTRDCTLDGKPVDGPGLCRRFNAKTGYDGSNSVPESCYRKTPNS